MSTIRIRLTTSFTEDVRENSSPRGQYIRDSLREAVSGSIRRYAAGLVHCFRSDYKGVNEDVVASSLWL